MITITLQQLKNKRACPNQQELFQELFRQQATFQTLEEALRTACKYYDKFDWNWASNNLLVTPARAEYNKLTASAFVTCYAQLSS